jgi:SAM-dependent methyltransferase
MANEAEIRRWNDERWTSQWPQREKLTGAVSPHLGRALGPRAGQRVLDIGCGGGGLAIAVAHAVGDDGLVVGVDVSVALLDLARGRASEAGVSNLTFSERDMQSDDVDGSPFDLALSQFGVMFFDEPDRAFANVRRQLRPGGRLAFASWQSVARNPWHIGTACSHLVPPPPVPGPGKSATGPFIFGDTGRVTGLLRAAGFTDIVCRPHDITIDAPANAVVSRSQFEFMGIPPERRLEAEEVVARHLERFHIGPDAHRFPLAFNIFRAQNPGRP